MIPLAGEGVYMSGGANLKDADLAYSRAQTSYRLSSRRSLEVGVSQVLAAQVLAAQAGALAAAHPAARPDFPSRLKKATSPAEPLSW